MHVVVLQEKVPAPIEGGAGSDVTGWSIIQFLLEAGHRVSLCLILEPSERQRYEARRRNVEHLEQLGVHVVAIPIDGPASRSRLARAVTMLRCIARPTLRDFYPAVTVAAATQQVLKRLRPDAIVGFPLQAVAAAHGLTTVPRMATFGDLDPLLAAYRWRATSIRTPLRFLSATLRRLAERRRLEFMQEILTACDGVVNLTAHHAAWLQQHGFPHCVYVPMPTIDMAGPGWEAHRRLHQSPRPKLLMIGGLRSTPTAPGLHLFAKEILPRLERRLGLEGFEVHLVGRGMPPPGLARALARPSVILRGFVEDPAPEFFSADVLLVPSPVELGARTRIMVGASFGCCIVAHRANMSGSPEFADQRDILLGDTGEELAEAVVRVLADPSLRQRLGCAARATYERHFSSEGSGRRLAVAVERMVGGRAPVAQEAVL